MTGTLHDYLLANQAVISLLLLAAMFGGFLAERLAPSAVASIGAALFLALGFISTDNALSVFSSPAAVTIAAMMVMSAALVRTGVLEALAARVLSLAKTGPRTATGLMLAGATALSAFVNSTPVIIVLIRGGAGLVGRLVLVDHAHRVIAIVVLF